MMGVIPFPAAPMLGGTVCVMLSERGGFEVGHESASGNSWGSFLGPFDTGQEAISAAYALNRDVYFGACNVEICDAARRDGGNGSGVNLPRGFTC